MSSQTSGAHSNGTSSMPNGVLPSSATTCTRCRTFAGVVTRSQIAHHNMPTLSIRATMLANPSRRSEEHTSELQSLMRSSYAVFCLQKTPQNIHAHYIQREQRRTPETKSHRSFLIR